MADVGEMYGTACTEPEQLQKKRFELKTKIP